MEVPVILDAREHGGGEAASARNGNTRREWQGDFQGDRRKRVLGVNVFEFCEGETIERIDDAVAMSGGWSPVVHLVALRGQIGVE